MKDKALAAFIRRATWRLKCRRRPVSKLRRQEAAHLALAPLSACSHLSSPLRSAPAETRGPRRVASFLRMNNRCDAHILSCLSTIRSGSSKRKPILARQSYDDEEQILAIVAAPFSIPSPQL
ncbi:hypothetical protein BDZ90DRAFT_142177 [Jaminaea rosea]|uniref:Uncharacterized protein n=1 Tax=Jaminaea rosea TaxID=1569628 RepID=A0A316UVA5_9BASI|nr:hypothetical protein BDZ90DRAFT_142177 [Jaminaea rosea]PWN29236.1 hypothetical protein BDZ90DRAFT_142177 [Jaminaea rosea]